MSLARRKAASCAFLKSISLGALVAAAVFQPGPVMAEEEEPRAHPPCEWMLLHPTPEQAIRAIYETKSETPGDCLQLSDRLILLFGAEEMRMEALDIPIGRLDFDWVVNGQDALITNVRVTAVEVSPAGPSDPPRQIVTARFDNFGEPQVIDYYWEQGPSHEEDYPGDWGITEVVSRTQGFDWVLSLLLSHGSVPYED